jgi:hypothetical protein
LTWDVKVSGLTSNITNGHIHGPALTNVNANVILQFDASATGGIPGSTFSGLRQATEGRAQGTLTLTSANVGNSTVSGTAFKQMLIDGMTYVNVHTTTNGGGEVRAQIVKP